VLVTKEGTVHTHSSALFQPSKLVSELLEESCGFSGSHELIPLIVITDAQFAHTIEFLTKNMAEPLMRIYTPLVKGLLRDSGVPTWAEEYIMAFSEASLLQLLETAHFLQIKT